MNPRDLAELFMAKARDDEVAAIKLVPIVEVADSVVGFHVQQAVEKALKAVLALYEVRIRKTHDIAALGHQIAELGIVTPEDLEAAMELTIYSVLERYPEAGPAEPLERQSVVDQASRILAWADQLISEDPRFR